MKSCLQVQLSKRCLYDLAFIQVSMREKPVMKDICCCRILLTLRTGRKI